MPAEPTYRIPNPYFPGTLPVNYRQLVAPNNGGNLTIEGGITQILGSPYGYTSPLTTKGDIFTRSGSDTRLPIGTMRDEPLIVDSAETTGMKWAPRYWLPNPYRNQMWSQLNSNTTSADTVNATAGPTVSGTASDVDDSTGHYANLASTTSLNALAGWSFNTAVIPQFQLRPIYTWVMKTGANASDLQDVRTWISVTSSPTNQLAAADPTEDYVGFRFDTSDSDTTWKCMNDDTGGTPTETNSGITVTTNTRYEFQIDFTDPASIKFYINRALIATHTTNIPTLTNDNFGTVLSKNLVAGTARNIRVSRFHASYE